MHLSRGPHTEVLEGTEVMSVKSLIATGRPASRPRSSGGRAWRRARSKQRVGSAATPPSTSEIRCSRASSSSRLATSPLRNRPTSSVAVMEMNSGMDPTDRTAHPAVKRRRRAKKKPRQAGAVEWGPSKKADREVSGGRSGAAAGRDLERMGTERSLSNSRGAFRPAPAPAHHWASIAWQGEAERTAGKWLGRVSAHYFFTR